MSEPKTTPFHQDELQMCANCGKGMAHDNNLVFYRIHVEQFVLDGKAIMRQHGLEQMMGGNAALAQIMGPNEPIAHGMGQSCRLLCQPCLLEQPGEVTLANLIWPEG